MSEILAAVEDEPLFLDDMSDFDVEEIFQGSQKESEEAKASDSIGAQEAAQPPERDEFADEMEAMNDLDNFIDSVDA